jgi:hypothetical protein
MNAPNRAADVREMLVDCQLAPPDAAESRALLVRLCRSLNHVDRGSWGLLRPVAGAGAARSTVIAWRDTMEVFRVIGAAPYTNGWEPLGADAARGYVWAPAWMSAADTQAPSPGVPPDDVQQFFALAGEFIGALVHVAEAIRDLEPALTTLAAQREKAGG